MISDITKNNACRWLSKSGGFSAIRGGLEASARFMSKGELRELYCFFRDHSLRWETEWRSEFLEIFGATEADLPKIDDADRWGAILHHLVEEGDLQKVQAFVDGIGIPRWNFTPHRNEQSIDVYPIDAVDNNGETALSKAQRLERIEIAAFLEGVRRAVSERYVERWRKTYGGGVKEA